MLAAHFSALIRARAPLTFTHSYIKKKKIRDQRVVA